MSELPQPPDGSIERSPGDFNLGDPGMIPPPPRIGRVGLGLALMAPAALVILLTAKPG